MSGLIEEHLEAMKAEGLSDLTIRQREYWLGRIDATVRRLYGHDDGIDQATTRELRKLLANPEWGPSTRRSCYCHMAGYYRWATSGEDPALDYDPTGNIRPPKTRPQPPRVAEDDQLQHALAELGRPALRAVILAAGAGMRAGEVAELDRDHITRDRIRIHGKGDKVRHVPMMPDVWDEVGHESTGPLILDRWGRPVSAYWVSHTVSRALDRIGLPDVTLHYFRGAYATRLLRSGVDIVRISRLLGHSSVAITMQYLRVEDSDLDDAVALLPPLTMSIVGARAG